MTFSTPDKVRERHGRHFIHAEETVSDPASTTQTSALLMREHIDEATFWVDNKSDQEVTIQVQTQAPTSATWFDHGTDLQKTIASGGSAVISLEDVVEKARVEVTPSVAATGDVDIHVMARENVGR